MGSLRVRWSAMARGVGLAAGGLLALQLLPPLLRPPEPPPLAADIGLPRAGLEQRPVRRTPAAPGIGPGQALTGAARPARVRPERRRERPATDAAPRPAPSPPPSPAASEAPPPAPAPIAEPAPPPPPPAPPPPSDGSIEFSPR